MNPEHLQFVADELQDAGFRAVVQGDSVIVSLNRPVSVIQVRIALQQIFGEIEFGVSQIDDGRVRVR